ncbi:MAG: hypothetical protein U9O53_03840 [archaeon]|nr:hypothetical protein [archaeon]
MKRILIASVIALVIGICLLTPVISADAEQEVRIADKTGDWGNPSPYLAAPVSCLCTGTRIREGAFHL